MGVNGSGDRKKVVRAVARVALAILGVLASITGLLAFVTGKNFPDLFAPASTPPAVTSGASGMPAQSTVTISSVPTPTAVTSPPGAIMPHENSSTAIAPTNLVITTTNAIKNFQLSVSPGAFPAAPPRTIKIETWEGGLNTYVDVEIADPKASGGGCPKLTTGPCNLIYSGGSQADSTGYSRTDFEWFGNAPGHDNIHHPGTYTVTAQDRGTGAKVSIDFTAQ